MLKYIAVLFILTTLALFGQELQPVTTTPSALTLAEKLLGPIRKDVPAGTDFMSTNRFVDYTEEGNVAVKGIEISHTDEITENEYFPPVNGKRDMKLRVIEITSGGYSGSRTFWFADPMKGKLIYYYPGFNCHYAAERYEFRDSVSKGDKGTNSTMGWKCGGREVTLHTTPIARNSAFAREIQDHFNTMVAKYYLPPDDSRYHRNDQPSLPKKSYKWFYGGIMILAAFLLIRFLRRPATAS